MKTFLFYLIIIFIFIYLYKFHCLQSNENFNIIIPDKGTLSNNIDSLFTNNSIADIYRNNYYYEYSNDEYKNIITIILKDLPPSNNYKEFIDLLSNRLYNSKELKYTQVVQDNQLDNNKVEVLLYRENKYEGKHVIFTVDNKWTIKNIELVGSIFEDKIAIFPVVANDPHINNNLIIGDIKDNDKSILDPSDTNTFFKSETIITNNDMKNKILNLSKNLFSNDINTIFQTNNQPVDNQLSESALYSKYIQFYE